MEVFSAGSLKEAVQGRGPTIVIFAAQWFVADDYQGELAFLGIDSSPAFVREPEGNGCVERFIRTLKENLLWVHRFDTIEDLRLALQRFKETYNRTWIVERHRYQTPAAIRAAQLAPLPAAA